MHGPEADFSAIMQEVCGALGAKASALTLHEERAPARALFTGKLKPAFVEDILIELGRHEQLASGRHAWLEVEMDDGTCSVLAMPVERVDGHSRLVLSSIFGRLDRPQREAAETVYLGRRPFAIGYFRLWQLERTQARRIHALEAALDVTELGVLLIDRDGHIVFSNQAATTFLDIGDGLRRSRNGLVATTLKDAVRLRSAVEHIVDANGGDDTRVPAPVLRIARKVRDPLIVSVVPMTDRAVERSDVAAIIYVLDPLIDAERLLQPVCKLYSLTPVETRLASLLTGGATLAHAASTLRVKEQTAKGCLKQVFLKTGVNRQSDLVRVLLSNLVRTRPDIRSQALCL